MNSLGKSVFGSLLMLLAVCRAPATGTAGDTWDVMVLDQLIASVPAGQTFAQVDDMMIPVSYLQSWRNKLAGGPQPDVAFSGTFTAWSGGNVYYAFDASVSASNQKAFLDAAAEWATFANLHFVARTAQANYLLVTNNASLGGGLSFVGMVGGAQLYQIGPGSWNRATLCHELGHALGLVHEHQRSDRDTFVAIATNNILSGHLSDFVKLTDSQNKSSYDFLSVMHYSRNAFSVNSASNTIVPLPAYAGYLNVMGQQFDPVLSASDRAGMAQVYGAGPGVTNIVTNTQDGSPGSLRAALYYAFDHPGTTITFNIPVTDPGLSNSVFNIQPSDALPGLWGNTTLDAGTEPTNSNPAGPEILLNGVLCHTPGVYPNGLRFRGTNSVARGFVINNFPNFGVLMDGSNCVGNTLNACYLGIDPAGTFPVTNGVLPVQISGGAISNTVGGTTVAARNVIGGSFYQGLVIRDPGTRNNVVEGNYIGVNASGTGALPNAWEGIQILGGAQSNLIGGYTASARNVISGNLLQGVYISDAATSNNTVAGNFIGLNPVGTGAIPNGYSGVEIGNGAQCNFIGPGNVLSGNTQNGVLFNGTANNRALGNYIGLNAAGNAAVPNGWAGVDFYLGAQSNIAGSNVISGNANDGVLFFEAGVSSNLVQGNLIGLNAAGTAAVGNTWAGVDFYYGPQNNLVGGNTAAARNVISGNGNDGVILSGSTTTGNTVAGNIIGLNSAGSAALANSYSGVEIYNGAAVNLIGGYGGARNFISGNGNYGVMIDNGSSLNSVQGNTIGLNGTNGAAIPNLYDAVFIYSAASNSIGGVAPGAANLISGSTGQGVVVYGAGSTNNTIRGNSIFNNAGAAILDYLGGNNSLVAPALTSAVVTTNTMVSGTYNGASGKNFQLDFYSDAPPAAGAESVTYLGSISVTGTGGAAAFAANLGARLPAGRAVTATATDPAGNTSQLSTGVAATMTSTPNDGIPNAWRALYFGGSGTTTNSQSAFFADPDHDGMSNYQEFLAGTNPTNAASALNLAALNPNTFANSIVLNSVNGTVYRVQYCDDLAGGSWNLLADQIIGTGTNIFLPDPAAASLAKRFYRAQVVW
jgi:hypothetical protein